MEMQKADVRVLLVDDEPSFRGLLDVTLRLRGYSQIENAVNGPKALELAGQYSPHLILMDTNMPGPYGYEVCRQMREDYERTAIIGMSGDDKLNLGEDKVVDLREEWMGAGADDFFVKSLVSTEEGRADLDARMLAALEKYQQ